MLAITGATRRVASAQPRHKGDFKRLTECEQITYPPPLSLCWEIVFSVNISMGTPIHKPCVLYTRTGTPDKTNKNHNLSNLAFFFHKPKRKNTYAFLKRKAFIMHAKAMRSPRRPILTEARRRSCNGTRTHTQTDTERMRVGSEGVSHHPVA